MSLLLKQDPFLYIHMPLYQSQSLNTHLSWKLWNRSEEAKLSPFQVGSQMMKQKVMSLFQSTCLLNLLTHLPGFTTLHSFKLFVLKNQKDKIQKKNGPSEGNCFPTEIWYWIGSSWMRGKTVITHSYAAFMHQRQLTSTGLFH